MENFVKDLQDKAAALGFARLGIIPAVPAGRLAAYLRWIDAGYHGEMGYMARPDRVERRRDLNVIMPGVKTIICVGLDYRTDVIPDAAANDLSRGRISGYAWGSDYHDLMIARLEELAAWIRDQDPGAKSRVYVDTGPLLERDHAEAAGLGFVGKNTMLIDPRGGSNFFLGEILTTLELPQVEHLPELPSCGRCQSCLDNCPTNAFPEPYVLDARRCISYLTIEFKGWIPIEMRPLMGNWVYGCDVCQDVCPFDRFTRPTGDAVFRADSWDDMAPSLLDLLALDDERFKRRFSGSPIKRIKRPRLVRNACVAAGNWGSETAVPSLIPLLGDPEPIVRGHAAWALKQIGTQDAHEAVRNALLGEGDERVRMEMVGV